jgi:RNA polymerase sigma-70 factor (ECF subfamily)
MKFFAPPSVSREVDERAAAIERVYHERYGGYRRAVAALLRDGDTAHDVVQDGFARALAERRRFRGGSLEAWIWRIIVRKAIDLRRARPIEPDDDGLDPAAVESDEDPELAAAIRALSPRRRLMVFLRYFADLRYADIAEVCGVDEGTVAATLARAHAELRTALASSKVCR